jgi:transcriptional regulator with XRE-family HTH domain
MLYDIEMTLGKRIRSARDRLKPKVTQLQIATAFRVSEQAVSGWERDEHIPELDKIPRLARLLKVPSAWLLEGKGPPPPPDALESVMDQLDDEGRALLMEMAKTLLRRRGAA